MAKSKNLSYWTLFVLILVMGVSGCKTLEEMSQKNKLDSKLSFYGKTVRWGALENLYGFLAPSESQTVVIPTNLNNIRVTDYEVRVPPRMIEPGKASQTAEISYLFRDRAVVKTLVDNQLWEFDETAEDWFRANPVPEFK